MKCLAPCPGRVISLAAIDDGVFSQQLVGPGVGIEPYAGRQSILAPAPGKLLKVDPHAVVIQVSNNLSFLVHIGTNTVRLVAQGFELLAEVDQEVQAGDPLVSWDPALVNEPDTTSTVVVVAVDAAPERISDVAIGATVAALDPLFSVS